MSITTISLTELLVGAKDGVFRFRPDNVDEVTAPGFNRILVPTRKLRDKPGFLAACAAALAFPAHFGHNWDAFYDCVAGLDERLGPAALLIFDDLSGFARTEPEEFDAAIDALSDACEFWRGHGARLIVLAGLGEPLLAPQLTAVSLR